MRINVGGVVKIVHLINLSYYELCNYLKNKYGVVNGNYFVSNKCCKMNDKIKRTEEGLYIHHIKEYDFIAVNLSDKSQAIRFPFEYQMNENLVYCNAIEHCLLHYHIYKYRYSQFIKGTIMEDGLTMFMLPQIKQWFVVNGKNLSETDRNCYNVIKSDKQFFIDFYNNFYKEFPNAPKYSYSESLQVKRKGFTSKIK